MANSEHLEKIKQGQQAWNLWREQNSEIKPDLSGADLSGIRLRGANLHDVNLSKVNFGGEADFIGVHLAGVTMPKADLFKAKLVKATLNHADLSGANLRQANLHRANLWWANLSGADLYGANLRWATLYEANLSNADLRNANLQGTGLSKATLTGAKLWEAQRAEWNIDDVVCESVFWDQFAKSPTVYKPGEFEHLYSDQTTIELFYEGGISSFELNTLPALLQHLASKHPDTSIHLKTIEQTGGGAKITISLGDADESLKDKIEADAVQIVRAQLSLRDNENLRLQIQNDLLREQHRETIRLMLASSAPQITFNAPVHTAAIPSGNAKVELHQTFNDNTALIQLIDKLLTRNTELTAAQSSEVEEAKAELQKPEPQKSRLSGFYDFLKTIPKEAILKGAGKLGEKAAEADWFSLLRQLGEVIHHLH
ncbi:pentapeptide repeat-containing protein [Acidicapsa dinghuensis]|uniref:Pentapeptide repeat-containing protein n=1 Tax=Acidicapsa dinghuensis TaxID=2218256 RepID=A0ABW1EG49_9BACT